MLESVEPIEQMRTNVASYYCNKYSEVQVSEDMGVNELVKKMVNKFDTKEEEEDEYSYYKRESSIAETIIPQSKNKNLFSCCICNNNKNETFPFIILSCNHIFHIGCLANIQFNNQNQYQCTECLKYLISSEIVHIHNSYLINTEKYLEMHQENINRLENQLFNIKEELKICYNYKEKLENERDQSKQIINITKLV